MISAADFIHPGLHHLVADILASDAELTDDEIGRVMGLAGRNNTPGLLWALYAAGRVPQELLAFNVSNVWSMAEFPEQRLPRDIWLYLFSLTGYTHDGEPAGRPAEPVVVYRGCTQYFVRRMAWTPDKSKAEWFARYRKFQRPTGVYEAVVEPRRLLAYIGPKTGRDEHEYVIDPSGSRFRPRRIARFTQEVR